LGKLQGVVNFYECLKETLLVYVARILFAAGRFGVVRQKQTTKHTKVREGRPMLHARSRIKAHEIFAVCSGCSLVAKS
jgi:hypothetical protein